MGKMANDEGNTEEEVRTRGVGKGVRVVPRARAACAICVQTARNANAGGRRGRTKAWGRGGGRVER